MSPLNGLWASSRRLCASTPGTVLGIFLLSAGMQCLFLTRVPEKSVVPHTRWEIPAVAVSIAENGSFADPYALPTGPTAHVPPVMPFVLGSIYRLLGTTLLAGYVGWLFLIATHAAMDAMLPLVGERLGVGRPAGVIAGLAGALVPNWPTYGEALTAVVLAILLVAFVRRWTGCPSRGFFSNSLALGAAWGAAFHLQPALLPVLFGSLLFEIWWRRRQRAWIGSAAVLLGAALVCLPWAWRNYAVLEGIFFIRSNLGLELRMGNHSRAAPAMSVMDTRHEHRHPRIQPAEARRIQEIGELPYMREARREAVTWIGENPAAFLRLTISRGLHFWFGPFHRPLESSRITLVMVLALLGLRRVVLRQSAPQRAAMLIPLLAYPLIYYVVAYMVRYTLPVFWIPSLFAAAAVWGSLSHSESALSRPVA